MEADLRLQPLEPENFAAQIDRAIPHCKIGVTGRDGKPRDGVRVRFVIHQGPAVLGEQGREEVTGETNAFGLAWTQVRFVRHGSSVIRAEVADNPEQFALFRAHSEGTTDHLAIAGPCSVAAGTELKLEIAAADSRGFAVNGASLKVTASCGFEHIRGEVEERGKGFYEARLRSTVAGEWEILVIDRHTGVTASHCVCMEPGTASRFVFPGTLDPRASEPYGELMLRARLVDEHGNSLNPSRIECRQNGAVAEPIGYFEREARFLVRSIGYSEVRVELRDTETGLEHSMAIPFAAVWMKDPGLVKEGEEFVAPVYGLPRPGQTADHATITITYDPEQVEYVGLEKHPQEGPPIRYEGEAHGGQLTIQVTPESPVRPEDHPNGVPICAPRWKCNGEGPAWFTLVGRMSPSTPGWEICCFQKKFRIVCICVNIIYRKWHQPTEDEMEQIATQFKSVVTGGWYPSDAEIGYELRSGNIPNCCPFLRVNWYSEGLGGSDFLKIVDALDGRTKIADEDDLAKIDALGLHQRDGCINIYLLPMEANHYGASTGPPKGTMVIDPSRWNETPNVAAHEMGHSFGLGHNLYDPSNLMYYKPPVGSNLSREQCELIWKNARYYFCH